MGTGAAGFSCSATIKLPRDRPVASSTCLASTFPPQPASGRGCGDSPTHTLPQIRPAGPREQHFAASPKQGHPSASALMNHICQTGSREQLCWRRQIASSTAPDLAARAQRRWWHLAVQGAGGLRGRLAAPGCWGQGTVRVGVCFSAPGSMPCRRQGGESKAGRSLCSQQGPDAVILSGPANSLPSKMVQGGPSEAGTELTQMPQLTGCVAQSRAVSRVGLPRDRTDTVIQDTDVTCGLCFPAVVPVRAALFSHRQASPTAGNLDMTALRFTSRGCHP